MNSTKDVIDNHIRRFREGNLEGVLDDYSPDAVMFTPSGTLRGRSEIKGLFQKLLVDFGKPTAIFDGDYAYLIWSAETADNYYEDATDTVVVRDGKIVTQSFAAKIRPKQ